MASLQPVLTGDVVHSGRLKRFIVATCFVGMPAGTTHPVTYLTDTCSILSLGTLHIHGI